MTESARSHHVKEDFLRSLDASRSRDGLAPGERLLVLAGGATALGNSSILETLYRAALERGVPYRALSEIVLQTHLFAGYPRAINALTTLVAVADLTGTPKSILTETTIGEDPANERGEALCRTIYGDGYDRLRRYMQSLHPDFDSWMVRFGYGRVLARPGLPASTRELAAVSALVVLDVPRQIRSHLHGARRVGASDDAIRECLHDSSLVASPEAVATAGRIWNEITKP
jgi:4-carboxymuconolactone decarboxylase